MGFGVGWRFEWVWYLVHLVSRIPHNGDRTIEPSYRLDFLLFDMRNRWLHKLIRSRTSMHCLITFLFTPKALRTAM